MNLQRCDRLPKTLFCINTAKKVIDGRPRSAFQRDKEPWKGLSAIGRSFLNQETLARISDIEKNKYGQFNSWESNLPSNWEVELINAVKLEYLKLKEELTQNGLIESFINIEMKIYLSFIKSGQIGILLDNELAEKKCLDLDRTYFEAVRKLEIEYGYFVSDFKSKISYDDIKDYIDGFTQHDFSNKYIWDSIELHRSGDDFLNSLYEEHYSKNDLSELLRIKIALSEKCQLQYDVVGTVSGRILVTRPGIQYLKKATRGIFIPSADHCFIYADYAQFEPGILAYLSADTELITAYNSGDIYSKVVEVIGNGCTREIAKQLFLSYMYGMRMENIKNSIKKKYGDTAAETIEAFFEKFSCVEKWKRNLINDAIKKRLVVGLTGYIRRFFESDDDQEISRWAPNHVIQSTASGIFKKALSLYLDTKHNGMILVPMHDAILIEVDERYKECEKTIIETCMMESYRSICPGITCKIHFDNFAK